MSIFAVFALFASTLVPSEALARRGGGGYRGGGFQGGGVHYHPVARTAARRGVYRGAAYGAAAVGAAAAGAAYYGYNSGCYRDAYGYRVCPNQY
jgi:hypothetical protein